jgi:hypothetical protein
MTTVSRTAVFIAALMMSGAAFAQAPAAPPAAAAKPAAAAPAPVIIKDTGLAGSEDVRYDLFYDRYVVANSNGYISTITGDGKVDALKFIANGQNGADIPAPAAVYVRNANLYVADATKGVRVFDLSTGKQTAKYDIPGAIALSGVAATADGNIYVSDAGKAAADGAIYRIDASGKVSKIASGAALKRPIGIDINSNLLSNGTATILYATGDAGDVVGIDPTGKEIRRMTVTTGKLSGVVYTDDGYLLASASDGTYVLDPYWKPTKVDATATAGVGWDWVRNKVLVAVPATGVEVLPGPKVPGFPGGG